MSDAKGKKKAAKMSLGEFLGAESGGSWADDTEGLPSHSSSGYVPEHREASSPIGYEGGRDSPRDNRPRDGPPRGSGPRRDYPDRDNRERDYPRRERSDRDLAYPTTGPRPPPPSRGPSRPIPHQPPYTAFVGNLPFDTTEQDLEDFFHPLVVTGVRLNRDADGRIRGFGYVEFKNRRDLEEVMQAGEVKMAGRILKLDVAEPPSKTISRGNSERSMDDRTDRDWRSRDERVPPVSQPPRRDSARYPSSPRVEEPKERKKLELKPRSVVDLQEVETPTTPGGTKKKFDPFGGAKPVDVTEAERKVEEKLKRQEEERKRLEEEKKKEKAEKESKSENASVNGEKEIVEALESVTVQDKE